MKKARRSLSYCVSGEFLFALFGKVFGGDSLAVIERFHAQKYIER